MAEPGEVLMRVENLSLHAGGRELQRGLNFDVRAGEVLAICGASGCGKSTLLRHMIGLQTPKTGSVTWTAGGQQRDVHGDDPPRREIGVAFQAGALWSSMTVGENLMLPLELYTELDAAERERQARFKLALAGLAGRRHLRRRTGRAVGRHAQARGHRPRADAGPAAAVPGRTLGRPGPAGVGAAGRPHQATEERPRRGHRAGHARAGEPVRRGRPRCCSWTSRRTPRRHSGRPPSCATVARTPCASS